MARLRVNKGQKEQNQNKNSANKDDVMTIWLASVVWLPQYSCQTKAITDSFCCFQFLFNLITASGSEGHYSYCTGCRLL